MGGRQLLDFFKDLGDTTQRASGIYIAGGVVVFLFAVLGRRIGRSEVRANVFQFVASVAVIALAVVIAFAMWTISQQPSEVSRSAEATVGAWVAAHPTTTSVPTPPSASTAVAAPLVPVSDQQNTADATRVLRVIALARSIPQMAYRPCAADNKSYYSHFIQIDPNNWVEFSEDPCNFVHFKSKVAHIDSNEIELLDDTRNPNVQVRLRINLADKKIYYKASNQSEWTVLYDILRYTQGPQP